MKLIFTFLVLFMLTTTNSLNIQSCDPIDAIVIYNANGKTLFVQKNIQSNTLATVTENWSKGVYFAKIFSGNSSEKP